ncbi:MAG: hypothetical protein JW947_11400 [Sedimentisphaerales bacterium]|nr:hypothetical protein [Sedimentisphaerales bacterium]
MGKKSFSGALSFGWNVMKSNFFFFLGVIIVASALSYACQFLGTIAGAALVNVTGQFSDGPQPLLILIGGLPAGLLTLVINIVLGIGIIKISLSFCDGKKPSFGTLFKARGCFWRYLGTGLLYGLILVGTSIACILPFALLSDMRGKPFLVFPVFVVVYVLMIVLMIKFFLCFYFVIDKGLGPVRALKASSMATEGAKGSIFVFLILCWLVNVLGMLCLGIGMLATIPTVIVAMAFMYRRLSEQTPELAELGIGTKPSEVAAKTLGGSQFASVIQSVVNSRPDQSTQSSARPTGAGAGIQLGQGVHISPEVQPQPSPRPAAAVQHREEKKTDKSFTFWLTALIISVLVLAGGTAYRLLQKPNAEVETAAGGVKASAKGAKASAKAAKGPFNKGGTDIVKKATDASNEFTIKGIIYSDYSSSVLIGETIAKEGDVVDGVKIIKIYQDRVDLERNGVQWTQRAK